MKDILGKRILFVTAHPDDESYLAAGTMLRNHRAGGKSFVACATFGEKGRSHLKGEVASDRVKATRKKELLAVSKFLKVSELLTPGLPDAELAKNQHKKTFFKLLLSFAEKHRPELMISFGADGVSGHIDHISAGEVARKVAEKLNIPFLTFSAPPDLSKSMEILRRRRKHGKYVKRLKHQPHDIEIAVNPRTKLKALHFHKSQLGPDGPFSELPPEIARQFLTAEYYSIPAQRGR